MTFRIHEPSTLALLEGVDRLLQGPTAADRDESHRDPLRTSRALSAAGIVALSPIDRGVAHFEDQCDGFTLSHSVEDGGVGGIEAGTDPEVPKLTARRSDSADLRKSASGRWIALVRTAHVNPGKGHLFRCVIALYGDRLFEQADCLPVNAGALLCFLDSSHSAQMDLYALTSPPFEHFVSL